MISNNNMSQAALYHQAPSPWPLLPGTVTYPAEQTATTSR